MLHVSFHPMEIGKQLDLLYVRFKCGAGRVHPYVCAASFVNGSFVRRGRHATCVKLAPHPTQNVAKIVSIVCAPFVLVCAVKKIVCAALFF